jgi:TrmH family RNA methyltransferase
VQPITSTRNPRVKYLRSLRLRKYRQREGLFLAEGIRIVEEALRCGAPVEALVYAPDLLVSERAKALVEEMGRDRRLVLSAGVFRSLSERDDPQGIAAMIRIEDRPLTSIPLSEAMLVVIANQLRDPGNLGSIIRTADAAGATGVVVVEPSVDLYDPQTVRSSMGSIFALPVVRLADEMSLPLWYKEVRAAGLPLLVVATSAHGEQVYSEVDYCRPFVLLVGSEGTGLTVAAKDNADVTVRLPIAGRASSLNVSAATAALIYEAVRQRQTRAKQLPYVL